MWNVEQAELGENGLSRWMASPGHLFPLTHTALPLFPLRCGKQITQPWYACGAEWEMVRGAGHVRDGLCRIHHWEA